MHTLKEDIIEKVNIHLADSGQFLVSVSVYSVTGQGKITIIIDGDKGVSVGDCAQLSRALWKDLEKAGATKEQYTLEVSSPGLHAPLTLKRQYIKNQGRTFRIMLKDKSFVQGTLVGSTNDLVSLECTTEGDKKKEIQKINVPFAQIEKAFVQPSFK